jgi:hypothetical protein
MSSDRKSGGPVRRPRTIERPRVPPGPLADLKAFVYELYLEAGAPSLDEIAAWVARDDELAGAPERDTIHRIIRDTAVPSSQADVVAVVTVLARTARWDHHDAVGRARDLWVAARMASDRSPADGIRVSEADPRQLGVHAAISVPGVLDEVLPEYVPRDIDVAEHGVRGRVTAAAERGGFVLLVGGSSVGKTRCALEAVRALLPDWWLVHPAGATEVATLARAPVPRTVVWLDELQRYLDGEHGLTGGVVRALLSAPHSVVIIGTLWPAWYTAYTTMPTPGGPDPHARERELLDLAAVVRIDPDFSPSEQDRARDAAARDRRLAVALEAEGYGLTQTLAAAPQLVGRWQDAKAADPYAWAVLTAALDAARLGARTPLSADLLRAAGPGYCSSQQQAEAPGNWFERALAYATGKLHGAAAALSPAGVGMGRVAGYIVADYLIQYASLERRSARTPASIWDAILSHIRDPADAARLADSARNRLLYRYAISLYRHAADAGDQEAAYHLAWLLVKRGDQDGAIQTLRARANAYDRNAIARAAMLFDDGDLDELRARADAGDGYATRLMANVLIQRHDRDGAIQMLRARADNGDWDAASELDILLAQRGNLDRAVQILRPRADVDDILSADRLAQLLAECGDLDELRARADAGHQAASWRLVDLLVQRGDLDELRARADNGDAFAAYRLDRLLVQRGDLDELRARADNGDRHPLRPLVDMLADRGDLDRLVQILRARADAGDLDSAIRLAIVLADVLIEQGRREEAERLRRFGLNPDGSIACT